MRTNRIIEEVEHFEGAKYLFTLKLSETCQPTCIVDFEKVEDLEKWSELSREIVTGFSSQLIPYEDYISDFNEHEAEEWLNDNPDWTSCVTLDNCDSVEFPVYAKHRTGFLRFDSADSGVISTPTTVGAISFPKAAFTALMTGSIEYFISTEEAFNNSINPKSKVA